MPNTEYTAEEMTTIRKFVETELVPILNSDKSFGEVTHTSCIMLTVMENDEGDVAMSQTVVHSKVDEDLLDKARELADDENRDVDELRKVVQEISLPCNGVQATANHTRKVLNEGLELATLIGGMVDMFDDS